MLPWKNRVMRLYVHLLEQPVCVARYTLSLPSPASPLRIQRSYQVVQYVVQAMQISHGSRTGP